MYYHFNEANGALENIYTLEEALAHGVMSEEARFQTAALEVYGQLISAQQAVGLTGIPLNFATVTNKDALMGFAMLGRETLVAMGFSPESVEQLIGINVNQLAQMQADALIVSKAFSAAPHVSQPPLVGNGWVYNALTNKWSFNVSGVALAGGFSRINNMTADGIINMYYFDDLGHMATGFRIINEKIYYFSELEANLGAAVFGWTVIDGIPCHFNEQTFELDNVNPDSTLAQIGVIAYNQEYNRINHLN